LSENNKESGGASSLVFFVSLSERWLHPRSKLRGIQPSWNKEWGKRNGVTLRV